MKKHLFFAVVILVLLGSCSQEDFREIKNDDIVTLWSSVDSDTRTYSANSVEAHVAAIQNIKPAHPIAKDFLVELKKYGYKESDFDLNSITRIIMTKSSAVVLSVTSKTAGETISAYKYNKNYCIITATQEGNIVEYSTIDGAHFASFKHDGDTFTFIDKTDNEAINTFSNAIYNDELKTRALTRANYNSECCRREATWKDCMACTQESLGFVGYALMLMWRVDLAVAGSCLGAGPNTFC